MKTALEAVFASPGPGQRTVLSQFPNLGRAKPAAFMNTAVLTRPHPMSRGDARCTGSNAGAAPSQAAGRRGASGGARTSIETTFARADAQGQRHGPDQMTSADADDPARRPPVPQKPCLFSGAARASRTNPPTRHRRNTDVMPTPRISTKSNHSSTLKETAPKRPQSAHRHTFPPAARRATCRA